ncbi:SusC/RagA family TonB-linked outer membrane protein [Flavobacterium sp. I-SCBP12n]|uniref:SusC/RagA family TonB-linked outer membrane protein n=1 Tax=Flavobacterium pygoscelis TaxID=2893176 RepID=A0A9X1XUC7_9FLAO|nr:SusC/RagA family TonB-linked outer membrane protein [Flavobacterium pygoscelis]MCK8141526.1 SusC/RagA family TonB-linked outer membrane protein [Flavobacterium pygoscelis]
MKLKFNGFLVLLLVLAAQITFGQERVVSGTVSDNAGMPLPGASVLVKGTKNGTQTDFDGTYSIKVSPNQMLIFTYIGMKTQELPATSSIVNAKLKDDSVQLEGVVVVGVLGIKRSKNALTSATQIVSSKELTQAANPNVVQSLVGKVSGLQINKSSSGVNGTTRIVLRGSRSITGNNEALIVIDNAISTSAALQQLPPELIESVNVIKGMQGAALYGEQGVNGVILVTTVKGKEKGRITVNVNSAVDFETVAYLPKTQQKYGQGWDGVQDPQENGSWGLPYDGVLRPTGLPQADGNRFERPYSAIKNNIKDFYQTGITSQNGFSINAGSTDSYALISANKVKTDFVVNGDKLERNSFLFKAGKKINRLSIDGSVNYSHQKSSETSSTLLNDLIQTPGNIDLNLFKNSGNEGNYTIYFKNPFWTIDNNRSDSRRSFINTIAALKYDLNKNISITYTGNLQFTARDAQSHINQYRETPALAGAGANRNQTSEFFSNQSYLRTYYGDLLVNFNYNLTEDLSLKANVGSNMQDRNYRITSQGGQNLDIPGWYHINNVLSPSSPSSLDNRSQKSNRASVLANVDLAYRDYLFLNLTGRNDWTSVLSKENNNFFYPSAGISFVPTLAFEGLKSETLNYLKLSANIVKVGNSSSIQPYAISEIGVFPTGFPYGQLGSYIVNQRPTDKNIKPEFVTTKELNLNIGLFNNRITIDGSAYISETKDLITSATASSASGLATSQSNIGDMTTKGLEIDLGLIPIKTENFSWKLRASYSTNKSVINSLAAGANEINLLSDANTGTGVFAQVGQEFPLIKGSTFVRDANGGIIVNQFGLPTRSSSNSILGKATPDYILGLTNSIEFKGITLTAVMDYRTGHQIISGTKYDLTWPGRLVESADFDREVGFILPNSVIQTAPGSGVYVPNNSVYTAAGYDPNGIIDYYATASRTGEHNVIDATAFKVRELSLSYSMPTSIIERMGLTALRFGINARNPFTVLADANKGYTDPEASDSTANNGNGIGYSGTGQYPNTRTFGGSINLTF